MKIVKQVFKVVLISILLYSVIIILRHPHKAYYDAKDTFLLLTIVLLIIMLSVSLVSLTVMTVKRLRKPNKTPRSLTSGRYAFNNLGD